MAASDRIDLELLKAPPEEEALPPRKAAYLDPIEALRYE